MFHWYITGLLAYGILRQVVIIIHKTAVRNPHGVVDRIWSRIAMRPILWWAERRDRKRQGR
jgi:hypothetical protein